MSQDSSLECSVACRVIKSHFHIAMTVIQNVRTLLQHQQPSPDSGLSATDHLGVGLSSQPSSVSQQYLQQSDHNGNTILPSSISPGDGADGNAFIKKGLLWQQRDKLFSRWKERFFILTKEYFHCFKKGSSRLTEMGGFIFKVEVLFFYDF